MTAAVLDIHVQRRRRRLRRARRHPEQLHIFSYRFAREGAHVTWATVLVRGRMGQVDAIGLAAAEARQRGREPSCTDINTVPAPRPTPALDGLVRRCTGFPTLLALLTAPAGYRPTIRLDLLGRDGIALALAYDRQQAGWGDPRRPARAAPAPPGGA